MNTEAKPWWASRTILGALVSLLATLAGALGVQIAPEIQGEITTVLISLAGVIGTAVTIYGRLKAARPIAKPGAGAAKALLVACLLGAVAVGGPVACASYAVTQAEQATPAQTVFAIQADYTAALRSAAAYVTSPEADPDAVAVLKRLDAVAYEAVRDARVAVRAGDSPATAAAIGAARAAVSALVQYMASREIAP